MILKYKEMMNTLKVTPEMRSRILNRLQEDRAAELRKKRLRRMYACASLAACLAIALMVGRFAGVRQNSADEGPIAMSPYGAAEYASASALSQALGFAVKTPAELPFEPEKTAYNAMFGEYAQIDYTGSGASISVRMAPGTEDISGDYNEYAKEETTEIGGKIVTLKGDDSTVSLATWTDGAYAYSISAEPAVSQEDMLRMVESMQ